MSTTTMDRTTARTTARTTRPRGGRVRVRPAAPAVPTGPATTSPVLRTVAATRTRRAPALPGHVRVVPQPAPGRATPPATSSVRLTRRGRWVLTLLLLGGVFALSVVLGSGSVATGEGGAVDTRRIEVQQGDTLWGIATRVGGPGETPELMHEIEQLNHLGSTTLVEGQVLVVPVS